MEPEAVIVFDAAVDHEVDPPVTLVGVVGATASSLTVAPAVPTAGCQPLRLPAWSATWNWTSVVPAVEMVTAPPAAGADQVLPLFVEVRYW